MEQGRRIVLRECHCGCIVLLHKDSAGDTVAHVWLTRCASLDHDYRPEEFIGEKDDVDA